MDGGIGIGGVVESCGCVGGWIGLLGWACVTHGIVCLLAAYKKWKYMIQDTCSEMFRLE